MTLKIFFANMFCVIGFLMMLLSGGCSLFVIFSSPGADTLGYAMLFGGIPFVIGWGFWAIGDRMKLKKTTPQTEQNQDNPNA